MKVGTLKVDGICAEMLREQEIRIRAEERARAVRIIADSIDHVDKGYLMAKILDEGIE